MMRNAQHFSKWTASLKKTGKEDSPGLGLFREYGFFIVWSFFSLLCLIFFAVSNSKLRKVPQKSPTFFSPGRNSLTMHADIHRNNETLWTNDTIKVLMISLLLVVSIIRQKIKNMEVDWFQRLEAILIPRI